MKISATIITLNEEDNIVRAIESLLCCDEIVVVDSGSTDRTCERAARLGARVVRHSWLGYAGQKNFAASLATHDWILSIDADEALSELLGGEICEIKLAEAECDAYDMPRLAQYLGRWIRHSGWYPDRKIRLYHRERAQWVGDLVHESVRTIGRVGHLDGNLLHYTCDSVSQHLRTLDRYTSLAAQERRRAGHQSSWWRLLADPPFTFLKSYVLQQGFRDGLPGVAIANFAALYVFLKHFKTRTGS